MLAEIVPSKNKRKPRYRRAIGEVKLRLQERDLKIIELVYKHRFVTSEHITALIPGSRKGILRRLYLLFHGGYLDRPPDQIKPFQTGSSALVYGLGNKGADTLYEVLGTERSKVDWTAKNRDVKRLYLEHTLMVTNFSVCLELACGNHGGFNILEPKNSVSGKYHLKVNKEINVHGTQRNMKFNLFPDKLFGLNFINEPSGKNKAFFLVEADRSTMAVKAKSIFRNSFFKKMVGYWDCRAKGHFKKRFGFENARILTLTISQERIESMKKACKELDGKGQGSRMFLFTTVKQFSLAEPEKLLTPIWQNGRDDELVSLLD